MWLTKKHKSWDSDFDLESLSDFPPKVRQTLASQDDYEGEYSSNKDSKTEPHKTRGERSREQLEIQSLSPLLSAPPLTIDLWLLGSNYLETWAGCSRTPKAAPRPCVWCSSCVLSHIGGDRRQAGASCCPPSDRHLHLLTPPAFIPCLWSWVMDILLVHFLLL